MRSNEVKILIENVTEEYLKLKNDERNNGNEGKLFGIRTHETHGQALYYEPEYGFLIPHGASLTNWKTIWPQTNTVSYIVLMTYDPDNNWNIDCKIPIYREDKYSNKHFINLIAETFNLEIPEPIEPDETTQTNWKERYNTCFDKKENLKTVRDTYKSELSELQSNFDILQSNLTNANFEIDKLKQEKADLTKQFEDVETELADAQERIRELEG